MRKLIVYLIVLFTCLNVFGVPKEQDRAILEGSNRELLPNPGFEARKSGWTFTGSSTFTLETSLPADGKITGKWNPSATGEFLRSTLITVPIGLRNRPCSLVIDYLWAGVSAEIKVNVHDGTNPIATVDLDPSPTDYRSSPPLMFTCPGSGGIRVELESTADAAEISLDSFEFGKQRRIKISQAELVAYAYYASAANCTWPNSGAAWDSVTDVDCPSITSVSGTQVVNTADNDLADIVFTNKLPPGQYEAIADFSANIDTLSVDWGYRIFDGTSAFGECALSFINSAFGVSRVTCRGVFNYPTGKVAGASFIIQSFATGGAAQIVNNTTGRELSWTIKKFPTSSAEVITLETVGWHIDANIGGTNPSLGGSIITSYTEIISAGLDIVKNTGSAVVEIPCSTTNPSTGLTCAAGSESLGVVFNTLSAGLYEVCVEFSHLTDTNASGTVRSTFQLIETPNNAQTILQEGKSRKSSANDLSAAIAVIGENPIYTCGLFTFNSAGQKTIRIMYEQSAVSSVNTNDIVTDRSPSNGQHDVHITVFQKNQQFPTPVFTELQNLTAGGVKKKSCAFMFGGATVASNCTATCTVHKDLDGCIDSVTRTGLGTYTVNFNASYFPLAGVDGDVICLTGSNSAGFGPVFAGLQPYIFSTNSIGMLSSAHDGASKDSFVQMNCEGAR